MDAAAPAPESPPFLLPARESLHSHPENLECDPAESVPALSQSALPGQNSPARPGCSSRAAQMFPGQHGGVGDTRSSEGTGAWLTLPGGCQGTSRYPCCSSCFVRASEGILIPLDPRCCPCPSGKDSGNRRTHCCPAGTQQSEDGGFLFPYCSDTSLTCRSPAWVNCAEPGLTNNSRSIKCWQCCTRDANQHRGQLEPGL